ncbi:MAG: ATP-binding cassette domain-containing protein, partial [Betaproteobacteria bacterium]|nr:ATP-binding cassette domain-containing protein [Betaproteobacteria bacterium]
MLHVADIHAYYGQSHVLQGVSLDVGKGEVVSLLGRNGSGKTTTLLTIMGYLSPAPGSITYDGVEIGGLPPYRISRMGLGFVPQERGIFPSLTVLENLTVAARRGQRGEWTLERVLG